MTPKITQRPLSYVQRLEKRRSDDIELVVIHCTELPDLATARVWGEKIIYPDSKSGNSGHYYIDRDGSIEQWVCVDRIAHHVRLFNQHSIGIELVNNGRYPHWFHSAHQQMTEPYPDRQLQSLTALLNHLEAFLPSLDSIAGHADLDMAMQTSADQADVLVRRKLDPGPGFPWADVLGTSRLRRVGIKDLRK